MDCNMFGGRDRWRAVEADRLGWRLFRVSLLVLGLLPTPQAGYLPVDDDDHHQHVVRLDSDVGHLGAPFVEATEAKSLLVKKRVKRGWSINSLNLLWEMEEHQRRDSLRAHQREVHLAKLCTATCWGRYGSWSECTVQCGHSGVQHAHRNVTPSGECVEWVKKHGCPGSSTVTRPCNRQCHNGGTLGESDCKCPDGFNGTCCESYISCGDPGAPMYGYIANFDFTYNSTVMYHCRYGYILHGEVSRRCQEDGYWSGHTPICRSVICPAPSRLENGWIELRNGSMFGSEAVYECLSGYYLKGHRKRHCQRDGHWSGPESSCEAVFCPPPPVPVAGLLKLPSAREGRTSHGGIAIYSCNYTHTIRGSRIRRCEGTGPIGIWSGEEPKCILKARCPSPKTLESYAELHCSADVDTGGEICKVACIRGYAREAEVDEYIECSELTGWNWSHKNKSQSANKCLEMYTPQITLQAESPYAVKDCRALRPQDRSLLHAEFSHILAVHDICMRGLPGYNGCHVTQVRSQCSDWLARENPYKLISRELVMTFNLTVPSVLLREVNCLENCGNHSKVCDTSSCLKSYVAKATNVLIDNVNKLRVLSQSNKGFDEWNENKVDDVLVSDTPTMAAGKYVLFAKDSIKISDVSFKCNDRTSVSQKYCYLL